MSDSGLNQGQLETIVIESKKKIEGENTVFEHGASITALWVGHHRALEQLEPKPLFADPWAHAFMGEDEAKAAFQRMTDCLQDSIFMDREHYVTVEQSFFAIRHRFLDDFILDTLGKS